MQTELAILGVVLFLTICWVDNQLNKIKQRLNKIEDMWNGVPHGNQPF